MQLSLSTMMRTIRASITFQMALPEEQVAMIDAAMDLLKYRLEIERKKRNAVDRIPPALVGQEVGDAVIALFDRLIPTV